MKTKKEEYVDRMTRDLKEWTEDISEFEIRVSRESVALQPEYAESIRNMKEKLDVVSVRLHDLRKSAGDVWTALRPGIESAKHELRDAFKSARAVAGKAA